MKNRIFIPLFLCSLVMISSPSHSKDIMYWGWGAGSCADHIEDSKDNNGSYVGIPGFTVKSWIQGYITGLNVKNDRMIKRKTFTDLDNILFELTKRCKVEPMSEISDQLDWIYKNKLE